MRWRYNYKMSEFLDDLKEVDWGALAVSVGASAGTGYGAYKLIDSLPEQNKFRRVFIEETLSEEGAELAILSVACVGWLYIANYQKRKTIQIEATHFRTKFKKCANNLQKAGLYE